MENIVPENNNEPNNGTYNTENINNEESKIENIHLNNLNINNDEKFQINNTNLNNNNSNSNSHLLQGLLPYHMYQFPHYIKKNIPTNQKEQIRLQNELIEKTRYKIIKFICDKYNLDNLENREDDSYFINSFITESDYKKFMDNQKYIKNKLFNKYTNLSYTSFYSIHYVQLKINEYSSFNINNSDIIDQKRQLDTYNNVIELKHNSDEKNNKENKYIYKGFIPNSNECIIECLDDEQNITFIVCNINQVKVEIDSKLVPLKNIKNVLNKLSQKIEPIASIYPINLHFSDKDCHRSHKNKIPNTNLFYKSMIISSQNNVKIIDSALYRSFQWNYIDSFFLLENKYMKKEISNIKLIIKYSRFFFNNRFLPYLIRNSFDIENDIENIINNTNNCEFYMLIFFINKSLNEIFEPDFETNNPNINTNKIKEFFNKLANILPKCKTDEVNIYFFIHLLIFQKLNFNKPKVVRHFKKTILNASLNKDINLIIYNEIIVNLSKFFYYFNLFIINNSGLEKLNEYISLTQKYHYKPGTNYIYCNWYIFLHIIIMFNSFFKSFLNEDRLIEYIDYYFKENPDYNIETLNNCMYYLELHDVNDVNGPNNSEFYSSILPLISNIMIAFIKENNNSLNIKSKIYNFDANDNFIFDNRIFEIWPDLKKYDLSRKEKYYNRNLLIYIQNYENYENIKKFDLKITKLYEVIKYCFDTTLYEIVFLDVTGVNAGGLTKSWFCVNYNSNQFIISLKNFLITSDYDFNEIKKFIYATFLLGYIHFHWFYISDELLDVLYLLNLLQTNPDIKLLLNIYLTFLVNKIENTTTDFEDSIKSLNEFNNDKLIDIKNYVSTKIENYKQKLDDNLILIDRKDFMRFLAYNSNDLDLIIEMMDLDLKAKPKTNEQTEYYTMKETVIIFLTEMQYIEQEKSITDQKLLKVIKMVYEDFKWGSYRDDPEDNDEEKKLKEEKQLKLKNYENLLVFIPEKIEDYLKIFRSDKPQFIFTDKRLTMYYCHLKNRDIHIDPNELISKITYELDSHDPRNIKITEDFQKEIIEEVIKNMTQREIQYFLLFSTGTKKLPDKLKITSTESGQIASHTCFNHIEIPISYIPKKQENTTESKEDLKKNLKFNFIPESEEISKVNSALDFSIGGGYNESNTTNYSLIGNILLPFLLIGTTILQSFR
jgi:hypothetical protein